jgi:hypothetical protein
VPGLASAVHSYTTTSLWSSVIFVEVVVVTGPLLQPGCLASLVPGYHTTTMADADVDEQP